MGMTLLRRHHQIGGGEEFCFEGDDRVWSGVLDTFALLSVETGAFQIRLGRRAYECRAGGVLLGFPGDTYLVSTLSSSRARGLRLPIEWLKAALEKSEFAALMEVERLVMNEHVHGMMTALHRSLWSGAKPDEVRQSVCEALSAVVAASSRASGPERGAPVHAAVRRARLYMSLRLDRPVSLEELEVETGLSKFHLLRLFKIDIGLTPYAYHLRLRITRALELLRASVSPSDVASQLGFADQSHFTRHFRSVLGFTPAEYARGCTRGMSASLVGHTR